MAEKTSRRHFLKYASVGAVGVSALGAPASARPVTQIDSCVTITEPGQYELASDITHTSSGICIAIRASNVTLDGNGHTLRATSDDDTYGVLTGRVRNVVVKNLTVSNFEAGFSAVGVRTSFENVVAANNRIVGVRIEPDADRTAITNSEIFGNGSSGVGAVIVGGLRISDNRIYSNGGPGIVFRQAVSRSTVQRNYIANNGFTSLRSGITAWEGGDQNKFLDNVCEGNRIHGLSINEFNPEPASKVFIKGNITTNNGEDGIFLRRVDDSTVSNNVVRQNADDGIELETSNNNRLTRNEVCENGDQAIVIGPNSLNNRLRANTTEC